MENSAWTWSRWVWGAAVFLPSLDAELVRAVNAVAKRFPVAVYYLNYADEDAEPSALSGLSHVQGLYLALDNSRASPRSRDL